MELTGAMPTEFDPTTRVMLATMAHMGVSDKTLEEDMVFLTDLFSLVASRDTSIPMQLTTEVLDCAFIGLVYHRHMPFEIVNSPGDEDGVVGIPDREANNYVFTATALSRGLMQAGDANAMQVMAATMEGAILARRHLLDLPEDASDDDKELSKQFLALASIGMLVHRLAPTSKKPPRTQ